MWCTRLKCGFTIGIFKNKMHSNRIISHILSYQYVIKYHKVFLSFAKPYKKYIWLYHDILIFSHCCLLDKFLYKTSHCLSIYKLSHIVIYRVIIHMVSRSALTCLISKLLNLYFLKMIETYQRLFLTLFK